MKIINIVISVAFLVLLVFGNGCCSTNSAITGIETAIGTSEPENGNIILSVRVQRDFLAWGPWQPPLTTHRVRKVFQSFERDIICVSSEVDAVGLRSLHFSRRNGTITLVRSYFPGQYPLSPCCDSHFFSFSFKGYPLSNLSINDSSDSRVQLAWKQPNIEENDLVVLDPGNGILKQYLIKTDEENSPPPDTCYWNDRSNFLSAGQINKIEVQEGIWPYWTYHMALSVKYGRSWKTHGHYKNDLEEHLLDIENITGFVYDYDKEVIAFSTQQSNYTFGKEYVPYRRLSLFGKECTVAFFTGYNTMYRKRQDPCLIYTERLFINGTIMLIDPYWMCEIPNKICKKNSTGQYVCKCAEGYTAVGDLCIKACNSSIPDGYLGMEILENTKCPTRPQSVCSVESCLNITVNFTCHEGEWIPSNTDAPIVSTHSIAATDCHRSCYFDPNAKECVTNKNREKTPEEIEKRLNDSIDQVHEAMRFCYENTAEKCADRTFKCYNGEGVILMTKVCDRIKDCTDASDELCGANKGTDSDGLFAILSGFLGIFSTFVSGGTLPDPGDDVPDEGEGSKCEWTSWEEIRDECDSICGKAGREGKTEVRFRYGEKCVPASKTRMKGCEEDNICLSCAKLDCQVDVYFKNFKEPHSRTDLRPHINAKSEGGKVSFSTTFTSDEICSCKIADENYLECKTKKKGTTMFIVKVENEADEELELTINVTIGDYPVEFIKDRLVFETFLESQTVNATDLARDEDIEDVIEFTKVELSDNPGEDILIRLENIITSLYFQIEEFVDGEINCSITVTSGGYFATSTVQLMIGEELRCPTCKLGDTLCRKKIIYEYYDFDSLETTEGDGRFYRTLSRKRKRVQVAGGKVGGKVRKLFTVIHGCNLPYNQYFKRWLKQFDMEFEPYPLISDTPYVLADRQATVIYRENSTNTTIFVDSQAKYLAEINAIYNEGVVKMKNITRTFIDMQHKLNIIGFASIYKLKPTGVSEKLNIQFDHIPPKSARPTGIDENAFSSNAPTLAISNFDHRSEVWKNCSTGNKVTTPILNLYDSYMGEFNYSCAIFANIKCIRDEELQAGNEKRIYDGDDKTAFKRYKEGLKGLVNLHFDYGINFNYAYKVARINTAARPYAAYCEIKQPDFANPRVECAKYPSCVEETFKNQTYYYVKNTPKTQSHNSHCIKKIKTERNILRQDRELLTQFIDGSTAKAEKELWEKCCNQSPVDCSTYMHKPV